MASRGILFAALVALVGSTLVQACRRSADPEQLAAVDSLKTSMEAAALTLNELDVQHYATADSILIIKGPLFLRRFADTLDRPVANALAGQFMLLREAGRMAEDHRTMQNEVVATSERLRALHSDLAGGALDPEKGRDALRNERDKAVVMDTLLQRVIANYRAVQHALQQQPHVDSLLADTGFTKHRR